MIMSYAGEAAEARVRIRGVDHANSQNEERSDSVYAASPNPLVGNEQCERYVVASDCAAA